MQRRPSDRTIRAGPQRSAAHPHAIFFLRGQLSVLYEGPILNGISHFEADDSGDVLVYTSMGAVSVHYPAIADCLMSSWEGLGSFIDQKLRAI